MLSLMRILTGEAVYDFAVRARNHLLTRLVRRSFASFGHASVVCGPARLVHLHSVSVGANVYLGSGCWLQGSPSTNGLVTLRIGDRVSVSGTLNASALHRVDIGDDVLIARDVVVSDHSHTYSQFKPVKDQGSSSPKGVTIGSGVWLGQGVVVSPGVTIGAGAVIGAYSVVKSDIPERVVAVGNPARVVKVI